MVSVHLPKYGLISWCLLELSEYLEHETGTNSICLRCKSRCGNPPQEICRVRQDINILGADCAEVICYFPHDVHAKTLFLFYNKYDTTLLSGAVPRVLQACHCVMRNGEGKVIRDLTSNVFG